jgi:hypothetical protein
MFLLLDSGAFSARTQKKFIDLDDYCSFIRANSEHIDAYVSLDVMPMGADRGTPSKEATEESAWAGWRNFLYMREAWGLDPIPVVHQGEELAWIDRYLKAGATYIGLSPRIMNNNDQKRIWLDTVWARLVDSEGRAIVKTHGFGMNALPLLFRYPWHTVDARGVREGARAARRRQWRVGLHQDPEGRSCEPQGAGRCTGPLASQTEGRAGARVQVDR